MNPFGNPFMPMSYPSPPAQQKNYETQSSRRKSRDVSERKVSTDCRLDKSKSTSGKQPFVVPMVSGIVPKEPYEHWKTEKAKKKKKKRGRPSMAPSDDPWDTDGETPDRSVAGHMSKSGELDAFRSQFEKHRKEMEEWKRQFMDQPPGDGSTKAAPKAPTQPAGPRPAQKKYSRGSIQAAAPPPSVHKSPKKKRMPPPPPPPADGTSSEEEEPIDLADMLDEPPAAAYAKRGYRVSHDGPLQGPSSLRTDFSDAQTNTYDVRYRDAEVQFDRPVSATKEMLRVQHREAEQRRQLQNNAWTELFGLLEESAAGAMHLMNHASDHALLGEIQGAETERRTAIEYYEDGARRNVYAEIEALSRFKIETSEAVELDTLEKHAKSVGIVANFRQIGPKSPSSTTSSKRSPAPPKFAPRPASMPRPLVRSLPTSISNVHWLQQLQAEEEKIRGEIVLEEMEKQTFLFEDWVNQLQKLAQIRDALHTCEAQEEQQRNAIKLEETNSRRECVVTATVRMEQLAQEAQQAADAAELAASMKSSAPVEEENMAPEEAAVVSQTEEPPLLADLIDAIRPTDYPYLCMLRTVSPDFLSSSRESSPEPQVPLLGDLIDTAQPVECPHLWLLRSVSPYFLGRPPSSSPKPQVPLLADLIDATQPADFPYLWLLRSVSPDFWDSSREASEEPERCDVPISIAEHVLKRGYMSLQLPIEALKPPAAPAAPAVDSEARQRIAAVKIQSVMRLCLAKPRAVELRKAKAVRLAQTTILDSDYWDADEDEDLQGQAAVRIQSNFRAYKDRKLAQEMRERREQEMEEELEMTAATKIQAGFRLGKSKEQVKQMKKEKGAAIRIQSSFRGHLVREHSKKNLKDTKGNRETGAATAIQATYRGFVGRQEIKQRLEEKQQRDEQQALESAATIIQAWYRGFRGRQESKRKRIELEESFAAQLIQSSFRGHSVRKAMKTQQEIQDKLNGEQQQEEREARERALEAAARADSDLEEEVMGRREEGDGTPPPQVVEDIGPSDEDHRAAVRIQSFHRQNLAKKAVARKRLEGHKGLQWSSLKGVKLLKSAITRYNVSDTEAVDLLLPKESQCTLEMLVVKGTDLGNMNQLEAINPYVVLQVGDEAKETTIKTNTTNPFWNEQFRFSVTAVLQPEGNMPMDDLDIQVKDMRFGPLADKPPLRGYVPLSTLKPGIQNNQIIQLRPYGKLHIQTKAVGFGVFVEDDWRAREELPTKTLPTKGQGLTHLPTADDTINSPMDMHLVLALKVIEDVQRTLRDLIVSQEWTERQELTHAIRQQLVWVPEVYPEAAAVEKELKERPPSRHTPPATPPAVYTMPQVASDEDALPPEEEIGFLMLTGFLRGREALEYEERIDRLQCEEFLIRGFLLNAEKYEWKFASLLEEENFARKNVGLIERAWIRYQFRKIPVRDRVYAQMALQRQMDEQVIMGNSMPYENQGAVNFGPNQYFTDTYGPYGPNVEYAPPAYGPPPGYYSGALYGYGGPFNSPAQYQSPAPAYGPPDYGQPAPYGYGQAPYNYAPAPPPPGYGPPSPSTYGQPAPVGYAGYAPEVPSPGRTSNRSGQHNVRFAGTDRGYVAPRRASLMGGQPMPPSMPMSYGVVVPAPAYGLPPRQHLTESPPKAYYDPQQLALPLPPNAPAAMRGYDDDGSQHSESSSQYSYGSYSSRDRDRDRSRDRGDKERDRDQSRQDHRHRHRGRNQDRHRSRSGDRHRPKDYDMEGSSDLSEGSQVY
jgi:hypothetical protein